MVALASQLIKQKASEEFKPEKYRNHYVDAVRELVKEKAKGQKIVTAEEPATAAERGTMVDLMDALRKSVQGDKAAAQSKASAKLAAGGTKKKAGTRR
jgi:DNA end-binding protein Ku